MPLLLCINVHFPQRQCGSTMFLKHVFFLFQTEPANISPHILSCSFWVLFFSVSPFKFLDLMAKKKGGKALDWMKGLEREFHINYKSSGIG